MIIDTKINLPLLGRVFKYLLTLVDFTGESHNALNKYYKYNNVVYHQLSIKKKREDTFY